ncbi:DNA-repair protein XRCC1 [Andrographis paniculata]|uniref:DNA-repair protein XRCC1 n=1 Tax=Andrographis paniculata TaxID=175694 RepID=UPI0021E91A5B|nr:DNA-repair protein XRCC1 [Andrographis paniculata]XP_051134729.1 DNA-repair protein XRCC1 [Andrographis paniculata]
MSGSRKRNLPSWMSSRDDEDDDSEKSKQTKGRGGSRKEQNGCDQESKGEESVDYPAGSVASNFSKLMEGVVFVLSGFVNPERGILRSQMLEMGAEYQPDWNSDCTLLVCAFANTPKFRQVKADGGTVISKDWISECYTQRKLVDIEMYLMHAGKPWRRQTISHQAKQDIKPPTSRKSSKQEEKGSCSKKTTGTSKVKGCFSPSTVKKWASEDLKRTISWLEKQDEKPEPAEVKKVATEGILTCLQDAIDAFKQGQGIEQIMEQWGCVPRLVEKLGELDGSGSRSKDELCREAMLSKQMYELEFLNMENDEDVASSSRNKRVSSKSGNKNGSNTGGDGAESPSCDSDATIEMTEEEIDRAYGAVGACL